MTDKGQENKVLTMPELMRKLSDKSLSLANTGRNVRDHLNVSHGDAIGSLSSALSLVANDYKESLVRTSQVAVMAASSLIMTDESVARCSDLNKDALDATKYDPFCESLYKSKVPYEPQGRKDDYYALWSPSLELIDTLSVQAAHCGLPLKWFVQIYICGAVSVYGDGVLGRYAEEVEKEYEFGKRWIKYRADHVLAVIVEHQDWGLCDLLGTHRKATV